MALGDPYASTAELKARLSGLDDADDDAKLSNALAAASLGIERECGRQFNKASSASARVYYPENRCKAIVDDFYTVTGLVIKTDESNDGTYETTWSASDYQLEPLNGVRDGIPGWPYRVVRAVDTRYFPTCSRRAPLEVTAQWGWTAVPASIKEACLIVGEELFKLKDAPFGVAGFAEYGAVRVRDNPIAANLILPYRVTDVAVGA